MDRRVSEVLMISLLLPSKEEEKLETSHKFGNKEEVFVSDPRSCCRRGL